MVGGLPRLEALLLLWGRRRPEALEDLGRLVAAHRLEQLRELAAARVAHHLGAQQHRRALARDEDVRLAARRTTGQKTSEERQAAGR